MRDNKFWDECNNNSIRQLVAGFIDKHPILSKYKDGCDVPCWAKQHVAKAIENGALKNERNQKRSNQKTNSL